MALWGTSALLILVLLRPASVASAGINVWTGNGPTGGVVHFLTIDPLTPTTLYAGVGTFAEPYIAAVFKSTDGGITWVSRNAGLPATAAGVTVLAIDPVTATTLYAGAYGGVFKSTDAGASWGASSAGLPPFAQVPALVIDPLNPNTLYASAGAVFKSTDAGLSWKASNSGLADSSVALAIDPQTPSTLYAGTDSREGVFKSTDSGASWNASGVGLPDFADSLAIVADPKMPSTLYTATGYGGVFKSTDSGASWNASGVGLPDFAFPVALVADPNMPNTLYTATDHRVFKSTNGGMSWSATDLSPSVSGTLAIDPRTPSTLYVGTRSFPGGVLKSTDGGGSWSRNTNGLPLVNVNGVAIDPRTPQTLYAATGSSFLGGVFKSTDAGNSWSASSGGITDLRVTSLAIDVHTPSTLYAGAGGGVFKSTDDGVTWQASLHASGDVHAVAIGSPMSRPLYAGAVQVASSPGGFYQSTDGGESWNDGIFDDIEALVVDPQLPSTLYAGTGFKWSGPRVLKSTDSGQHWVESTSTESAVLALAIDPTAPTTVYAATASRGNARAGVVLKSSDDGTSWSASATGLPATNITALAIDPQQVSILYAGTENGVFRSTDAGASWSAFNAGLPDGVMVSGLAVSATPAKILYAATQRGVFALQTPTFTVNSTADAADAMPGDGVCAATDGACTLRAAIDEANALPGADSIAVPAGTYGVGLGINGDLTVIGAGAAITKLGGISVVAGVVSISGMTIEGGFGVTNEGTLALTDVTISGNSASGCSGAAGAGLSNRGTLTLTNSTVSGNTVDGCGQSPGFGAGILNAFGARLTIVNSTISGNTARSSFGEASGGGLYNAGHALLINATISGNTAASGTAGNGRGGNIFNSGSGDIQTENTVVADSTLGGNCSGTISSLGHNLSSDASCGLTGPGDLSSTDPQLGPLQDNGGATFTRALQAGSLAIDAGSSDCPATDQRGISRPQGVACDIGAYERVVTRCLGDCGHDGQVTVDELLTMVNIALGNAPVGECTAGDHNRDAEISIDEILTAVNAALNGCPTS
jgi:CSLREA domain-containing protein